MGSHARLLPTRDGCLCLVQSFVGLLCLLCLLWWFGLRLLQSRPLALLVGMEAQRRRTVLVLVLSLVMACMPQAYNRVLAVICCLLRGRIRCCLGQETTV